MTTAHRNNATPPRRRHLRRVLPIWLVLASLALGLLATAASVVEASYRFAWWNGVLGFRPVAWAADIYYEDRVESVVCYAEWGMERWHWDPGPFDPDPRDLAPDLARHTWPGTMPVDIDAKDDPRPAMARVPDPGYESNPRYFRAGWPFFAAEGREIYGFPTGTSAGRTHEVIGLTTVRIYGRYVEVPLRPIWPGVLGNTLFYAVPAALVLSALRVVVLGIRRALRSARARRRARRGRCIGCGYELGEGVTVCPECGLALD